MRGALGSALWVVIVLALGGCATSDPPPFRPFPDAGPFFTPDATFDGTVDAFVWPDTGPPLPTVIPAQAWLVRVDVNGQVYELTLNIDARAEAGIVRVVGGAGGRATNAIFDILPGGVLQARDGIPMGVPGDHMCTYDTISIADWSLRFGDADHDGTHETLEALSASGWITQWGPNFPPSAYATFVSVLEIRRDDVGPTLTLANPSPVIGYEPIVLVASEPVRPAFMPRLVGPRTVYLAADVGAASPARWSVSTRGLPPGHYDLVLDTEIADVSAHVATAPLPTLAFDVAALTPPPADDFDAAVVGVLVAGEQTVIGDEVGEVALAGATSLHTVGRTVLVFDSPAGRRTLSMSVRFEGPNPTSAVPAMFTVYDSTGRSVGQATDYQYLTSPSSVPGFDLETPPHGFSLVFVAATAGRYYVAIDPGGPNDVGCTGSPAVPGIGMTLDQVSMF